MFLLCLYVLLFYCLLVLLFLFIGFIVYYIKIKKQQNKISIEA